MNNQPGIKPLWIITFTNTDPNPAKNCEFNNSPNNGLIDVAKQYAAEAEKIREELVNLKDVVEQFRDFLKRFKKEI